MPGGAGSAGALLDQGGHRIKVTTLELAALVSLLIFSGQGQVDWRVAGLLAAGIVGALLQARLALGPNAAKWVFRLLIAAAIEVIHLVSGIPVFEGQPRRPSRLACRRAPPGARGRASSAQVTSRCRRLAPGDTLTFGGRRSFAGFGRSRVTAGAGQPPSLRSRRCAGPPR